MIEYPKLKDCCYDRKQNNKNILRDGVEIGFLVLLFIKNKKLLLLLLLLLPIIKSVKLQNEQQLFCSLQFSSNKYGIKFLFDLLFLLSQLVPQIERKRKLQTMRERKKEKGLRGAPTPYPSWESFFSQLLPLILFVNLGNGDLPLLQTLHSFLSNFSSHLSFIFYLFFALIGF